MPTQPARSRPKQNRMAPAGLKPNELLALLQQQLEGAPEPVPENFRTRQQWAEKWGVSLTKTGELLRSGMKNGVLCRIMLRARRGKTISPVPFYGPTNARL